MTTAHRPTWAPAKVITPLCRPRGGPLCPPAPARQRRSFLRVFSLPTGSSNGTELMPNYFTQWQPWHRAPQPAAAATAPAALHVQPLLMPLHLSACCRTGP